MNSARHKPVRKDRIAKIMARAGVCSRREAERWIAAGRVSLNGEVLDTPACVAGSDDVIAVDGQPLKPAEPTRVWRYHKPAGLVVSHRDEKGRESVFDRVAGELGRVVSVGRLDIATEGLLLLTNDGELARHLELPATGWIRRYRVRAHGKVDEAAVAELARGVTVEGVKYAPVKAVVERRQGANVWLAMALREGKNREVKKLCAHLGLAVNRLIRVSFGPFQLGRLARGEIAEVPAKQLREQLGAAFFEGAANAHRRG